MKAKKFEFLGHHKEVLKKMNPKLTFYVESLAALWGKWKKGEAWPETEGSDGVGEEKV